MLDFSSALYLGFRHPSAALSPWPQLTSGTPATMGVPEESVVVARRLADLLGATRATLLPSTLHLFWDLFVLLAGTDGTIFVDAGAYPIARSGVERAAARGIPVRQFPHHDPDALARVLRRAAGRRPLVLVDGICPECGAPPLRAYSELTARQGGTLVIDDTQALGVLGVRQPHARPFGAGGGGSLRWHGLAGPHIVIGASLAKGFGVPLAVLAGAASVVARFERGAETRMHGSPPSMAAIRAAEHALELNRVAGDGIRHRLGRLVVRFRAGVAEAGLRPHPTLFPVQTVIRGTLAIPSADRLGSGGVRVVVHRGHDGAPRLSFLITAAHDDAEIDAALTALQRAVRQPASPASAVTARSAR